MAVQRMKKRADFPAAKVSGDKEDAFAASFSLSKVFKTIVHRNSFNILLGVSRKKTEFGHLPAQVAIDLAQDFFLLLPGFVGKGDSKIAHAHAAQPRITGIGRKAYTDAECSGDRPRQQSEELRSQPDRQIFEPVSHAEEIWTVTSAEKYFKLLVTPASTNASIKQANGEGDALITTVNTGKDKRS